MNYIPYGSVIPIEGIRKDFRFIVESVLDKLAYNYDLFLGDESEGYYEASLSVVDKICIEFPFITDLMLIIGEGNVFVKIKIGKNENEIVEFVAYFTIDITKIQIPRSWLIPAVLDEGGKYVADNDSSHNVEIDIPVGFSINQNFEVNLISMEDESVSFSIDSCFISNTGFYIKIYRMYLKLCRSTDYSQSDISQCPDDFMGVYVEEVEIGLPEGWKVNEESSSAKIVGRNLLIGTGGVSGTIGLEPKNEGEANLILHCTLGEWEFGLESFSVTFEKNAVTASDIHGSIHLPEKLGGSEIGVSIALSGNGDFSVTLNTQELQALNFFSENSPYFTYKMVRAVFGKDEDRYYLGTSGSISFEDGKMKNILKADIVVDNLRIWSDGKIDLSGGGINLKDGVKIQVGPAQIFITSILCGTMQKKRQSGEMCTYNYFGFDGGLNVKPGGIEARGTGIKFCYRSDGGTRECFLQIESIGIDITIPGNASPAEATALIEGWLAVGEETIQTNKTSEETVKTYSGGVSVQLPKLRMGGSMNMKYTPDIPAWIIEAGLNLSTPIALGATGLGIYGFTGLFGRRYIATKSAAGVSDDASWYDYYKAKPTGVAIQKFSYPSESGDYDNAFSAGAGVLLATMADGGKAFSGRLFLLFSVPDMFLLEGKARILGDRVGYDGNEPPFYAFVLVSDQSVEAGFGANLSLPKDDGGILKIHGDAELGYYFSNPKGWKVNIGSDSKPLQAILLSLFNAEAYMMMSHDGIRIGGDSMLNFNQKYLGGMIRASVESYIKTRGMVSFEKPQIGTYAGIGGECGVGLFGFYFSLGFDTGLGVEAIKPFEIEGSVDLSVGVRIFRKRITKQFTVEFSWILRKDQDTSPIVLMDGNGAVGVHMLTDERYNVLTKTNGEPSTDEFSKTVLPIDSYIELRFKKNMNPSGVSGEIYGGTNAKDYMESIPPKPVRKSVRHEYKLEDVQIYARAIGGTLWEQYFPYKASAEGETSAVEECLGHWQNYEAGRYNTLRLLSLSPFCYMDSGQKGWATPESYGITGTELYCEKTETTISTADWSGEVTGRMISVGTLRSRTQASQTVSYTVRNGKGKIEETENAYSVIKSLRLKSKQTITLRFCEPVTMAEIALSGVLSLTIRYGLTTTDENNSYGHIWSKNETKSGAELLSPIRYEDETPIDTIEITVTGTVAGRVDLEHLIESYYESDDETERSAILTQIVTVSKQTGAGKIAASVLSAELASVSTRMSEAETEKTRLSEEKLRVEVLISRAERAMSECKMQTAEEDESASSCAASLRSIVPEGESAEGADTEYAAFMANLTLLMNGSEQSRTNYNVNYQTLRMSGMSFVVRLHAQRDAIAASIETKVQEQIRLLEEYERLEQMSSAITENEVTVCKQTDSIYIHTVSWETETMAIRRKSRKGRAAIEAEYQAKVAAIEKELQPVWRPNTDYKVVVNVKDVITVNKYEEIGDGQTYSYYFRTGSQVTNLLNYVDYRRSYPNANGDLLNSKPLYYDKGSLQLLYKKNYVAQFFRDWAAYSKRGGKSLPAQYGRMNIDIIDPLTGTVVPQSPQVETKYTPSAIVSWEDDETSQVPHGMKAEDILRNGTDYNSSYTNGLETCWETRGKKIRPAHKETIVSMQGLRANSLYTAIVYNEVGAKTQGTIAYDKNEVHRYLFTTSRYASLAEHIGSYKTETDDGGQTEAIYKYPHTVSGEEMKELKLLVESGHCSKALLESGYGDPYERLTVGVFGINPMPEAERLEINKVLNDKGELVGIIVRSPEPLLDPKISNAERKGFCTLKVQKKTIVYTYKNNYLYSKDCSQVFITTDNFKILGMSYHLVFRELKWTGVKYEMCGDSVETGDLKIE